jgi:hypothetical protein
VEHVFAGLEQLGGKVVPAMTLPRNELAITPKCRVYKAKRSVCLVSQGAPTCGAGAPAQRQAGTLQRKTARCGIGNRRYGCQIRGRPGTQRLARAPDPGWKIEKGLREVP